MGFTDETVRFNLDDSNKKEISETLTDVYKSLNEKGYNPINQIVGYVSVVILRTYLAITTPAIKSANMSAMRLLRSWFVII